MLALAMSVLVAMPVLGHHSFAMFDLKQSVTLHGTVKEFQWTNPHCFLQVLVPARDSMNEWSVEMHSPADMYRHGWRPGTLKPGEEVTVVIHPDRDGSKGGLLVSAIASNGRALELPGGTPGAPGAPGAPGGPSS
jgi:Family of unknown function (DUF6152)